MASLIRLSLLGALPGGEQWSVNPVWGFQTGPESVSPIEAAQMVSAVNSVSVPGTLRAISNAATTHVGCRVEARAITGALETVAEGVKVTPVTGSGVSAHPYQTSWVTSLRSTAVGGSGRGRLYWPATGTVLDSDTLRPIPASVVSALTGVQDYLSLVGNALQSVKPQLVLCVWSRTQNALHEINTLQMGDVLDVQRRRRDTLTEAYSIVPWTN